LSIAKVNDSVAGSTPTLVTFGGWIKMHPVLNPALLELRK
jgi:hypothetical protein